MQEKKSKLDIIIPVFNEEKISNLFELLENNVKLLLGFFYVLIVIKIKL